MKQEMRKNIGKLGTVFIISSILVSLFVLWGALFPSSLNEVANAALTWMIDNFGWFYMLITALFIFFVVGIAISPYGKVRLGKRNDRPEYSWFSWIGMLFAAGIGVGFVFWGLAYFLGAVYGTFYCKNFARKNDSRVYRSEERRVGKEGGSGCEGYHW